MGHILLMRSATVITVAEADLLLEKQLEGIG